MGSRPEHLDDLLNDWPYEFGEVAARLIQGGDGREVIQMRIDLGLLQMETSGRPDGAKPEGFDTYFDLLIAAAFSEGAEFELTDERRLEIDREFVQFYHRRIAWLALREFRRAVADADHTLSLMDFSSANAPREEWTELHEQYRMFVLFHRTQAAALAEIDDLEPEAAVAAVDEGLEHMKQVVDSLELEEDSEEDFLEDPLVQKLLELKEMVSDRYELAPPLKQQLDQAIAREEYELAARIRDQISGQGRQRM